MCNLSDIIVEEAKERGRKEVVNEAIQFMISIGISKDVILKKYSKEDYNE